MNEDIEIDCPDLISGMFRTLENANYYIDHADDYYKNNDFKMSVSTAIIGMEESLKCHEFAINLRKFQKISKEHWNKLKTHRHKLVHVKDWALKKF